MMLKNVCAVKTVCVYFFVLVEYCGDYLLKLNLLCIPYGNLNAVVDIHSELIKLAGNIRYYQWRQWV